MHPNYYFPWLFDEPTAFFPVCVESGSSVAGLYEEARRAGEGWVAVRRWWAEVDGRGGGGEEGGGWGEEGGWRGVEEGENGGDGELEMKVGREWRRLDEESERTGGS